MRIFFIVLGIVCVILAGLGVLLPGLPATPFLLLASYAFARSSKRMHDWLINNKVFGPILSDFLDRKGIRLHIKIISLVMMFRPVWSPWAAPVYAVLEGLFLGAISAFFEYKFHGIVIQAAGLTFLTLFAMLFLYRTGIIKVTEKFRMGVFAATGAIALMYLASFILGLFGVNFPMMHSGGTLGIVIGVVICGVAALNLVLDFDFIEKGSENRLPKYMEWYSSFALMVTLVWLYLEILRLLSRINSRN